MQYLADMAAGFRFDEIHFERHELVVVGIEAPIEDPGRFHGEFRSRTVIGAMEFAHPLAAVHERRHQRQQCCNRNSFEYFCH